MSTDYGKIRLSESYGRAITSTLAIVEEMLSEMEVLINCKEPPSLFTETEDTIPASAKKNVLAKIRDMKTRISEIKDTLSLPRTTVRNTTLVLSRNGKIWELLCDLHTKKLKNYGRTPEGLPDFLDPLVSELISITEEIPKILRTRTR